MPCRYHVWGGGEPGNISCSYTAVQKNKNAHSYSNQLLPFALQSSITLRGPPSGEYMYIYPAGWHLPRRTLT